MTAAPRPPRTPDPASGIASHPRLPDPDAQPSPPPPPVDLRLVVCDLDGTLLDGDGRVPDGFWPLLAHLQARGVVFTVASGRQLPTLAQLFGNSAGDVTFIAENGTYIVHHGRELASTPLSRRHAASFIQAVRTLVGRGRDLGTVYCARRVAYVERRDEQFVSEVSRFFTSLKVVDDLLDVDDAVLKFSVFDTDDAQRTAAELAPMALPCLTVASTAHWIDVMPPGVNKGVAVRQLQESLGVGPDQTAVFGDYLNDLEMFDQATHSFAMANAHPDAIRRARHLAPSNRHHGVLTTLHGLLAGSA